MNNLKQRLVTNWHAMRIFRLGTGTMLIVAGIQNHDLAMGLLGIFFLYQAATDTGCCSDSSTCRIPRKNKRQ